MTEPDHEHGIEFEPHLQPTERKVDPSELLAQQALRREKLRETDDDRIDHNVWEEPALSKELVDGPREDQLTYARWLQAGIEQTTIEKSMKVTLLVALAAGPWGVLGAFWTGIYGSPLSAFGLIAVVVFGPVTEEVVKVSAAWWVVEKRPFWFQTVPQIIFCAACGGAAFAAIENLIYMYVYVPDHSAAFVIYRWTVCVGLHVGCSLVAGLGLAKIWDNAIRNLHRPKVALGVPYLVIAIVVHGFYNLTVTIASLAGWLDFLN